MKFIFTRHGESQANILHEVSNHGLKHPLTPAGRDQASALASKLQHQAITHIYSSPLLRAIETSVIVANYLGIEYEVRDALREYDVGLLDGRSDPVAWQMWQDLFDSWTKHQRWEQKIEGGESFYEVKNRFVPFIDSCIQEHKGTDANLLCIAHGGLYWMMLPLVLKNIDLEFIEKQQGFPHMVTIVAELFENDLICVEWNGIAINAKDLG
jgi:broad specificity phosphatase PhoE